MKNEYLLKKKLKKSQNINSKILARCVCNLSYLGILMPMRNL